MKFTDWRGAVHDSAMVKVLLLLLVLVTACGGRSSPEDEPTDVLATLKQQGLPIGNSLAYTAETDRNNLLGKPGQYTAKITFADTRLVPAGGDEFDVYNGGSIEFFASEGDARKRVAALTVAIGNIPDLQEYSFLDGNRLLRISQRLTPDQAREYETAFKSVK
jgi:hypothetical protein